MQWKTLCTDIPQDVDELTQVLLSNRSIAPSAIQEFFSPVHPFTLQLEDVEIDRVEMENAVDRIRRALDRKEEVVVFGDYDADGVTATAILWETLFEMGVKAIPFIPHREKHGYGMTDRSLDALLSERQPSLIITVDNGIVAHAAIDRLAAAGIDVIVTDHHMPERVGANNQIPNSNYQDPSSSSSPVDSQTYHYPNALAIVHSTKLCGATVAWFLARELDREKAETLLDLCAIATIADQMILTDANRSFAHFGIQALRETTRVGLKNLFSLCEIDPTTISTKTINYAIGPRINAMGRIASALDALRALCIKDQQKSLELMQTLQSTNTERQELTIDMLQHAREQAAAWKDQHIIVVSSSEYHEGVIGLIAGKLVEEFHKPAIAISVGETFAKASARSVNGVNIVELIREVRSDLLEVGGHPMAAGFGLLPEKVEIVRSRLEQLATQQITKSALTPSLTIECELPGSLLTIKTVESLQKFEPYGNGNMEPVFAIRDLIIKQSYAVGKEGRHIKLTLETADGQRIDGIGFGLGSRFGELQPGNRVSIAGLLAINSWNNHRSVQVVVKDVATS